MNIFMVASEANPLIKTGGLGDVTYALSKELVKLGQEVSICLPFYQGIEKGISHPLEVVSSIKVRMSWREEICNVFKCEIEGINYYLFQNQHYFERQGSIYGFYDDGERFACFSLAVSAFLNSLKKSPDIVHLHDWQPGMIPVIVRENLSTYSKLCNTKFILTIHNPAFQGLYDKIILGDFYGLSDELYDNGKIRFKGMVSTLKAAIVYCDEITTVSPTHREELLSQSGGMELDSILNLRKEHFVGILNGIDYEEFSPSTDKYIFKKYTFKTSEIGKHYNKVKLASKMGLADPSLPLFGFVSRMTWQKGMNLVFDAIHYVVSKGSNAILLGSGEYNIEQELERIRAMYPNNVAIYIGYNNELAHQVYAASDFFLMPSLFEPCGIGQMIAERYGSLPIVRRTGGLKDSVIDYQKGLEDMANGFTFDAFESSAIVGACTWALMNYKNEEVMKKLITNALKTNNSWKKSAKLYLDVYNKALSR